MDALTHIAIGASVAQLPLGASTSNMSFTQKALVGSVAAVFPDIDYLLFPLNPLEFLAYWHRSWTHSIILAPFWALLLTLGWRYFRGMNHHAKAVYRISLAVLLSHCMLDSLTMYGTQWLAPLNDHKLSMNLLFVIDAYFTVCALILLAVVFFYQTSTYRWMAVLLPVAYLGLVYQIKQQAYGELAKADASIEQGAAVTLLPQPFSPFYWQAIDQNQDQTRQAYLRLTDDAIARTGSALLGKPSQQDHYRLADELNWHHYSLLPGEARWREQAQEIWSGQSFAAFRDFAVYPVIYRLDDAHQRRCIWFTDLRYHWPNAIPPFRFGMCKLADQDWTLHRMRYFSHETAQIPEA